jgi:regulator of Ty1 transposition protein 103
VVDLEKARGTTKATFSSASSSSTSSVPSELQPLAVAQQNLSKLILPTKASVSAANQEFEKLMDPTHPVPSPPVYAARLHGLLKTLANTEGAVSENIKARKELMSALEKFLATNRAAMVNDENHLSQLAIRKKEVEEKKAEVELAIMRGLGPADSAGSPVDGRSTSPPQEPDRPEIEALTPPSVLDEPPSPTIPPLAPAPGFAETEQPRALASAAPGIEMLSNLASQYQSLPISTNGSNKRRRVESDDFPDLGGDDGIDADVAEMLRKDSTAA